MRPILLIDEAQDMHPAVLNELRLMSSTRFDSRQILSVVFAGDQRFPEKLKHETLISLGSRMRRRLLLEKRTPKELLEILTHLVTAAGNPRLMTPELRTALAEHLLGNPRVMANTAAELLMMAAEREQGQLDEKLFLEYSGSPRPHTSNTGSRRSSGKRKSC